MDGAHHPFNIHSLCKLWHNIIIIPCIWGFISSSFIPLIFSSPPPCSSKFHLLRKKHSTKSQDQNIYVYIIQPVSSSNESDQVGFLKWSNHFDFIWPRIVAGWLLLAASYLYIMYRAEPAKRAQTTNNTKCWCCLGCCCWLSWCPPSSSRLCISTIHMLYSRSRHTNYSTIWPFSEWNIPPNGDTRVLLS